MPDVPEVPLVPVVPEVPLVPDVPDVPDVPEVPEDAAFTLNPNCPVELTTTVRVSVIKLGKSFMKKLEPVLYILPVKMCISFKASPKVELPSTSNSVPLSNCNLSDFNLAVILFEPAFIFANSISPSSEPSEASCIFAVILAYTTS